MPRTKAASIQRCHAERSGAQSNPEAEQNELNAVAAISISIGRAAAAHACAVAIECEARHREGSRGSDDASTMEW